MRAARQGRQALRAKIARPINKVAKVGSAADEAARLAAQREANLRSDNAVSIAAVQGGYARCRDLLEEARARILDMECRIAGRKEGNNPTSSRRSSRSSRPGWTPAREDRVL